MVRVFGTVFVWVGRVKDMLGAVVFVGDDEGITRAASITARSRAREEGDDDDDNDESGGRLGGKPTIRAARDCRVMGF